MKSRYTLLLLAACCLGLTGCANWQNRTGRAGTHGTDSTMNFPPASPDPQFAGPGLNLNEPPPPMAPPPSDPFLSGPPPTTGPVEKLNLAAVETKPPSPATGKMYNLESSAPSKKTSTAAADKPAQKSSAITRLAEKSERKSVASVPEQKAPARSSALDRLSRSAKEEAAAEDKPTPTSLPKPERAAPAAPAESESDAGSSDNGLDTTFMAAPVRKGADAGDAAGKQSKGPQSNLKSGKLFGDVDQPAIYPVSSPASQEQPSLLQFT